MFCFFAMGFVDLVGIASNYVKEDFLMGLASDAFGQVAAVLVMAIGVVYLFTYSKRITS